MKYQLICGFITIKRSETHDVTVEITDVNDNAPKFSKQSIKLAIPESEFVGLTYDLCRVTDEDLGMNSLLKWVLIISLRMLVNKLALLSCVHFKTCLLMNELLIILATLCCLSNEYLNFSFHQE